jgi:hypothetical protein
LLTIDASMFIPLDLWCVVDELIIHMRLLLCKFFLLNLNYFYAVHQ